MKTSPRNQHAGTIQHVKAGPVTTEASIAIAGGPVIAATLTSAVAGRGTYLVSDDQGKSI